MNRICIALLAALLTGLCRADAGHGVDVSTVQFGPHNLKADIYQTVPAQAGPRPAVLLIHGGGWGAGRRDEFAAFATDIAKQGLVAIGIDYRLSSTGARWPAQADDVENAVWFVRENARRLQIDTNRIAALGGSAGGHLASWLATTDRRNRNGTSSRVNLLISLWGPWDLTLAQKNLRPDARNMILALIGKGDARAPSTLYRIDSKSAPALLIHGSDDTLVPPDQSQRACSALHTAGVACELVILDGENHAISRPQNAAIVRERIARFVIKHFH